VGVPLLIIGDQALVGAVDIPAKLPELVGSYLAAGGSPAPDLDALARRGQAASPQAESEPENNGMLVAWITILGMLAAVVVAGGVLYRALQGHALGGLPRWVDWAIPVLALAGLGVALYMTYIEVTHVEAICGPLGDCNAVQNSPYATLFGWLPVGVLGLLGYLGILGAWGWGRWRKDRLADYVPAALLGMTLFGTIFSIYLTYLEIFVILAVCIWCISSAILITLLMLASLPKAAAWLAAAEEGEA
jgi:uncharacterized membrane protein